LITLNSGAERSASLGAIAHVGPSETIRGPRHEGAKQAVGGEVENVQVAGTGDAATTLTEIQSNLESDDSIGAVLARDTSIAIAARDAVAGANSQAKLATLDLSGDVGSAIEDGSILFAVDQQYLQGSLPVVFLMLNKTNANTVGGGQPVLTGPGFVDKDNPATVKKLAEHGTR